MCESVNVSVQQQWDWTVAMDDAFSERFHHCFLCGHRARWHEIREVTGAWLVGLCVRCLSSAGWAAVEARLREAVWEGDDNVNARMGCVTTGPA
jgi:hypothetical protein